MRRISTSRRGFTLIEVIVVMAIVGVVVTAAVAPLVYSVSRLLEAEEGFREKLAFDKVMELIAKDVFAVLRMAPTPSVRLMKSEVMGNRDLSVLIAASSAPAAQDQAVGSVVYKVHESSAFLDFVPGLYRWVLPSVFPQDVEPEKLDMERGQLVLPDVTELKIQVLLPPDWNDSYSGGLPVGMKIELIRGEERGERVDWFPN
jgi:prepilin-type N-terminal cleavage/methylation domain-containing protein